MGKKYTQFFNLSQGPLFTNRYLFHFVKCFLQNWSNTHFAFNVPSYHLENTKWAELVNLLCMEYVVQIVLDRTVCPLGTE